MLARVSGRVQMPAAVGELERLRRETPELGVGVHLTVTEGRPFRLAGFWRPAELARALGEVDGGELRAEWQAQIEALLATGLVLTHLDSHHHVAYRHGKALAVLFDLARTYRVPVRNPYPIGDAQADALAGAFAESVVRHPRRFVDVFDRPPFGAAIATTLAALAPSVTASP